MEAPSIAEEMSGEQATPQDNKLMSSWHLVSGAPHGPLTPPIAALAIASLQHELALYQEQLALVLDSPLAPPAHVPMA